MDMTISIPEADALSSSQPAQIQPDLNLVYRHPSYIIAFSGGPRFDPYRLGNGWFARCISFILPIQLLLKSDLSFITD